MILGSSAWLAPRDAFAKCPERDPADPVCEQVVSLLMPSVAGAAYVPNNSPGPFFGGGVEFALLSWATNSDAFGPSHGRLRGTFTYLAGPDSRRLALYRFGAIVSFEGNASRRILIPYFGAAIGGLWHSDYGGHATADASLGLYIVNTRSFILDLEGGYVMPFTDVDALIGLRTQLTAAFALW